MFLTSLLGASNVHKLLKTTGIDSHWGVAEGPEIREYTRFIFQKDHSTKNIEFGLEECEPGDRLIKKTIFPMTRTRHSLLGICLRKICTLGDKHKNVYSHDVYSGKKAGTPQISTNRRVDKL